MEREELKEMINMSTLEEKVDTLIRFCIAESDAAQLRYRVDLCQWAAMRGPMRAQDVSGCIDQVLTDLGVPDHLMGYGYLRTAIDIAVQDPETIHYMTGLLYPKVAKCHDATAQMVERSIRHAIQNGWDRCDEDVRHRYFGGKVRPDGSKPTNSEYIARAANLVRRQMVS